MSVLVLSGGGQGVWSMLGALSVMYQTLNFDVYIGTSVGGIVATLLSIGFEPNDLFEKLNIINISNKPSLRKCIEDYGFCEIQNIIDCVLDLILTKFEYIPTLIQLYETYGNDLVITSVCLNTQETIYFQHGTHPNVSISDALYATCSIPFIVKPHRIEDKLYIDGGMSDHFPITHAKQHYNDKTVYGIKLHVPVPTIHDMFSYTMNVLLFAMEKINGVQNVDERVITLESDITYSMNIFKPVCNKHALYENGKQEVHKQFKPIICNHDYNESSRVAQ